MIRIISRMTASEGFIVVPFKICLTVLSGRSPFARSEIWRQERPERFFNSFSLFTISTLSIINDHPCAVFDRRGRIWRECVCDRRCGILFDFFGIKRTRNGIVCVLRRGLCGDIMISPRKGDKTMKKTKTFKVTIEGLTLQDIIEILALRGETLPEDVTILLR